MCGKILTIIFVLIAIILGILGTVLTPERMDYVILVSKFFDIMLPVLAVGGILKYLCSCTKSCSCSKCGSKDNSCQSVADGRKVNPS